MPIQYYLEASGVPGATAIGGFGDALQLTGFNFQAEDVVSQTSGGGLYISAPQLGVLQVDVSDLTGVTGFLSVIAGGHEPGAVALVGLDNGAEVFRMDLSRTVVTDIEHGLQGGYTVSLAYDQIGQRTEDLSPTGVVGPSHAFAYDVATRQVITTFPAEPTAHAAAGAVDPGHFFLLLPGINGGSTDRAHAGWFDISGLDVHALSQALSGPAAGRLAFDPVSLTLRTPDGIAGILAQMGAGAFAGARIEGMSPDGHTVLYDLDLVHTTIAGASQDESGQTQLSLGFGAFKLTTVGLDAQGAARDTHTISWDTVNNDPTVVVPTLTPASGGTAIVPAHYVLEVNGQSGASTLPGFTGGFDVKAFHWDGAALAGQHAPSLEVTFADRTGIAEFLADLHAPTRPLTVSLVGTTSVGSAELSRLNLGAATVQEVHETADGGYAVTFAAPEFGIESYESTGAGAVSATTPFSYDEYSHRVGTTLPPSATISGHAAGAVQPTSFYLMLDGLGGGAPASAPGLAANGWFQLSGFDADQLGGSGGVGEMSATLDGVSDVAGLLSRLEAGAPLVGAKIVGVANGQTVYELNLETVDLTHVQQDGGGFVSLGLGYAAYSLRTSGLNALNEVADVHTASWNFATNTTSVTLATITPDTSLAPVETPTRFFLENVAVHGQETATGVTGGLDVTGFSFGFEAAPGGGGRTAAAQPTSLELTVGDHTGFDAFLDAFTRGADLGAVSLVGTVGNLDETYRLNLAEAMVSSISDLGPDGYKVSLSYKGLGVIEQGQGAHGAPTGGPVESFGYSIGGASNKLPPDATAGHPGGAIQPNAFYLLVDGVDGGATDRAHAGWFNVVGYSFDNHAAPSSGAGAAPTYGEVSITVQSSAGITDLLKTLAATTAFKGVRLEGVHEGSGMPLAVYDLTLQAPHVVGVQQTASGQYQIVFDYAAAQLKTVTDDARPSDTVTWSPAGVPFTSPVLQAGASAAALAAPTGLALDPTTDSGVAGDNLTSAHQLQIDGSAPAGATVTLYEGTTALGSGAADAGGHFQITTSALGDGAHALTAVAAANGVTSPASGALTVNVDSIAPDAPSGLALDASADTGAPGDNLTSARQLIIDGHAEAGARIALYDGATQVGTATADAGGAFQVTTDALSPGPHALTALATDAAGNAGPASDALTVTIAGLSFPADTGTHLLAEQPGATGATGPDYTTATLPFTDGLGIFHSIGVSGPQAVWSGGALPAAVSSALAHALGVALSDSAGSGSGLVSATFALPDATFDFLAQGETLSVTYTLTLDDGHGDTASQPVTFTVQGANDTPTLAADPGHSLAEAAGVTSSAAADTLQTSLAFQDPDLTDVHTLDVSAPMLAWSGGTVPAGLADSLAHALTATLSDSTQTGAGAVTASFSAPDATFDFLGQGETLSLTYQVTVSDTHGSSATQPVTITVTGANDAPQILAGGTANGTVAELAGVTGSSALDGASGAFTFHDPDLNDRPTLAVGGETLVAHTATGAVFQLSSAEASALEAGLQVSASAAGDDVGVAWSYAVQDHVLDFLGAGETVTLTAALQVDDHHGGVTSQPVTLTFSGANDAPVGGPSVAGVQKGAGLAIDAAHGVLANASDPDIHDILQVGAVNGAAAGVGHAVTGTYGSLTLNADGSYAYTANGAALPSDGVGQDLFGYTVSDGHGGAVEETLALTVYSAGTTYLQATPGTTTLASGNAKQTLDAGVGDHALAGGNGADVLVAGFGSDTLTGGHGPDVFVFDHLGFGHTVITDFAREDMVQFDHHLLTGFNDMLGHAHQVAADVVITLDAQDVITLQGVALASLKSGEFLFV